MQEICEINKRNWMASCVIKIDLIDLTGLFWITCMTGVLILEWPNLVGEGWHWGRGEGLLSYGKTLCTWFKTPLFGGLLRGKTEFPQDNEMKEWVGIEQDWLTIKLALNEACPLVTGNPLTKEKSNREVKECTSKWTQKGEGRR